MSTGGTNTWHTVRLMMLAKQDRAPTAAQGSRYGCRCSSCPGSQYGTQLPHKWQGSASAPPIADPNTVPARNGTWDQRRLVRSFFEGHIVA